MIKSSKFARKPFFVDAIRITPDNMQEVAEWCQGEIRTSEKVEGGPEEKYVKVRVHRPLTDRQTRAFAGDWVLYAGTGFKVYTDKAFQKSFESVEIAMAAHTAYRDATTGEFVDMEYAKSHPGTTVGEKIETPIFKAPAPPMRSDADLS